MRTNIVFKPGDRVVIRDWDAMVDEFGVDRLGDTGPSGCFVKCMRHLCGQEFTIARINEYCIDFEEVKKSEGWAFYAEMIRHPWDVDAPGHCEIDINELLSAIGVI